jgi:hypothetical protein
MLVTPKNCRRAAGYEAKTDEHLEYRWQRPYWARLNSLAVDFVLQP